MNARNRLVLSLGAGLAAFVAALPFIPWFTAALAGWDLAAAVFVVSVWLVTRHCDADGTRQRATGTDNSRVVADAVLVSASLASLVGVGFTLLLAATTQGAAHAGLVTLAVVSVVLSWASVHTVYTLHYARLYYAGTPGTGIDFHSDERPSYGDFAYVALTIGMTFQVSDTDLNSKAIRMTALRHALLSYLFGVVIVAMTINVVASLLAK